ncbi:MAG: SH3 domain-containing protein [Ruminococcus flavefaciens]|nr:SH3 domain-containing protein [Ruminococcus flavefaciens]
MKKYIALGLGLSLSLLLVACGGQQTTQEPPKEPDQVVQQSEPVTQPIEVKQEEPAPAEPLAKVDNADIPAETVPDDEIEPVEVVDPFAEANETVYATGTVNIRSSWSAESEKLGALSKGDSVTRTGIGVDDAKGWSRVILADGSTAYISNKYLSTTKPVVQQQQSQSNGSSQTQQQEQQSTVTQQPSGEHRYTEEELQQQLEENAKILQEQAKQFSSDDRWADDSDDFYEMTPEERERAYIEWGQQRAGS